MSIRTRVTATPRTLLRAALGADAAVTGLNGLAYVAVAGVLDPLLGVPATALRGAGAFLLVFAALVALLARAPRTGAVRAVVAVNVLWALGSIAALVAGWYATTVLGSVWIVAQALVVAAFAAVQVYALRS